MEYSHTDTHTDTDGHSPPAVILTQIEYSHTDTEDHSPPAVILTQMEYSHTDTHRHRRSLSTCGHIDTDGVSHTDTHNMSTLHLRSY